MMGLTIFGSLVLEKIICKVSVCSMKCESIRSSRVCRWNLAESWMRSSRVWMRSGWVVRASDFQCQSRNSPGFDPSILRHSGISGAADEAVLNTVHRKNKIKKIPLFEMWLLSCASGSLLRLWESLFRLCTYKVVLFLKPVQGGPGENRPVIEKEVWNRIPDALR